jgi:hypothetical protein
LANKRRTHFLRAYSRKGVPITDRICLTPAITGARIWPWLYSTCR